MTLKQLQCSLSNLNAPTAVAKVIFNAKPCDSMPPSLAVIQIITNPLSLTNTFNQSCLGRIVLLPLCQHQRNAHFRLDHRGRRNSHKNLHLGPSSDCLCNKKYPPSPSQYH